MPKLIFTLPEFAAQSCELPEGTTTVGRSSRSDLVILDESVSADHCELLVSWNEVIVREHGSKNGTWVAGRRVTGQWPVNHGDTIRFGRVEARLELPELPSEDTTENTTHLLRQQAAWTEPVAAPFHAVVQPEDGEPGVVAPDSQTMTMSAPPGTKGPPATPAEQSGRTPPSSGSGGARISWWLALAAVGAVLFGVWLLGSGR